MLFSGKWLCYFVLWEKYICARGLWNICIWDTILLLLLNAIQIVIFKDKMNLSKWVFESEESWTDTLHVELNSIDDLNSWS